MSRSIEMAVVGGGASAVCLLDELSRADGPPGGITLFEPAESLWRGLPFQSDLNAVRVNAPPDEMSVRCDDSEHFARWLAARGLLDSSSEQSEMDDSYVPRAVYGEYLEHAAREALTRLLERGWRLKLVREAVESIAETASRLRLRTETGRTVTVDHGVLCVGVGRPADVYGLTGTPGFIPDPYPTSHALAGVDPDTDVAVLGSGLTGVDAVLALAERGHRGHIGWFSRAGVLPGVRQRPVPYTLQEFTPQRFRDLAARGRTVTLAELSAVVRTELTAAGANFGSILTELATLGGPNTSEGDGVRREDPVQRLRRHLSQVDSPELALRILQRAVPEAGPDVWPLLAESDKETVLHSHYRAVMSLCCPMPPANAARLLELADSGQLDIHAGLREVTAPPGHTQDNGGFTVVANGIEHRVGTVVNAVSVPAHKIPATAQPLTESLLAAGLAERHPHGGLHVERATSRLTVGGEPHPRLFVLGDLAAGSLFFTFGIPSLVDRAHDIVATLVAEAELRSTETADAGLGALLQQA